MKEKKEKIVALTAYDYLTAKILDESGVDLILVGDSAANVIFGYETTLPIDLSAMLMFTSAVARAVKRAFVVGDMPFLSYQISKEEALKNAGLFLKAGAQGVKLEGGEPVVPIVEHLVKFGIPVMGHLGLTPQSVHQLGGYKLQARTKEEQEKLLKDALMLEEAGCFAIVLEKVPMEVAKIVTERLKIPTIGIGAGPYCDGQILVLHDMLGLNEKKFKFVKRYADLLTLIKKAVSEYLEEVKKGKFPNEEHSFKADESC
ncbi:MAG: 3-methyl-2-oxobutanoate hydroxymethyltransferase [candidate division WOR-3 bacterium]|uniref:3-methyl-2-oxobutanoate hydroxymethyltransferase n=1 Tax=candidate division WOR-3 bacterium TaxID=2052148 RepID=A0A7C4S284_UNCW3